MSSSFNPIPTPRRPSASATSSSHSSVTPASSRFRSSLVPMNRASPLRSSQRPSRVAAGAPTTSNPPVVKDLFRTTTTPKPSRTTPFAPKLPLEVTKTPASVRKLASKGPSHGMAGTTSQELFKQRIPSPDPGLTGAAISEAVPSSLKNRKGTVYADQYLAHKCPPEFDEDQRRQFFCILDLRRLKYAANEIFAKKDWKLNMINFAKEYEKSRGLIMLRYGLYQFKNVKPSEEVMRRWRKAHNLPEPTPESEKSAPASANSPAKALSASTSTKRKASDDVQMKDSMPLNSGFNQNKRRTLDPASTDGTHKFAPTAVKSKRKANEDDDDDDENSRSKLQKSTPSAARSRLEGIINNVQSGSSTPVGSPLKRAAFGASASAASGPPMTPLFGVAKSTEAPKSAFAVKSNPYGPPSNGVVDSSKLESTQFQPGQSLNTSKDSVLSSHKFGSGLAPKATNIFGYLSESSANNSGAENGDDSDSEDDESQPETGSQDAVPSAVASTGTATPPVTTGTGTPSLFGLSKPAAATSNPFASSFHKPADDRADKPEANASKGGLFGRVSFGSDGQPLRETSVEQTSRAASPVKEAAPEAEPAKTPAPAKGPGDFTFNAATTPITFGSKPNSFTSATPAPPTDKATESQEAGNDRPNSSSSLFGTFKPPTTTEAPATSLFATKPSEPAQSLFGAKKPEESARPLFAAKSPEEPAGSEQKPSNPAPSLFGAKQPEQPAPPLFGAKPSEQPAESTQQSSQSLFGAKPSEQPTGSSQQSSQSLFGSFNKPEAEKTTPATSAGSLFGETSQPTQSLFGAPAKPAENDKAGATPTATTSLFGVQPPASATFSFGSSTPAPQPLFGESSKPAEAPIAETQGQPKSLFGSAPEPNFGAQPTSNGFSAAPKEPASGGFSFGKSIAETPSTPSAAPMFGGFQPSTEPPKPAANLFGGNPAGSATPLFGNNNSSAAPSNLFGAQPSNPFGGSVNTSSKRGAEDDSQPAKKVMFGRADANNDAASQPSAPSFSFGASQSTAPASSQPEKKSMFGNVTGESAATNSPVAGRKILTPKRLRGAGAGAARQASPSPAPSFEASGMFGSQPQQQDAPASGFGNNNASFTFGQQGSAPSVDNNASSSFTFGQNSQPNGNAAGGPSFTFGGGPAPGGGSSFTFGAGGGSPNPFANNASGPSTQSFGGASGTPTPSGSFNFQFGGQQAPSAPAPADQSKSLFGNQTNGATPAPTFNFTSASPQPTPTQSSTNLFAPQPSSTPSVFSALQPKGAPGANSPFPAASSINTTPVNGGTPEPQAAQAEGDAEAPQEQISLTEGRAGEEDEETVHEVRAKAIKYVDVKPGEDSPSSKSPWQTQGIGQLRLLKHKTTGQVRVLLRADPRGHIAMNKSLLSGVEYKADKKTVRVMASTDDGTGLETWVLQVKEPAAASKLAEAFETWKASNKSS